MLSYQPLKKFQIITFQCYTSYCFSPICSSPLIRNSKVIPPSGRISFPLVFLGRGHYDLKHLIPTKVSTKALNKWWAFIGCMQTSVRAKYGCRKNSLLTMVQRNPYTFFTNILIGSYKVFFLQIINSIFNRKPKTFLNIK